MLSLLLPSFDYFYLIILFWPTGIVTEPSLSNKSSQKSYEEIRHSIQDCFPESKMLSFSQVRSCLKSRMGILPLYYDMCEDGCVAFVTIWAKLLLCPYCGKSRYKDHDAANTADDDSEAEDEMPHNRGRIPCRQFLTIPIGSQLQARW